MAWDVSESSGEDGLFGWAERWGGFVLVGMVTAATVPDEGRSEISWGPQDRVRWPHGTQLFSQISAFLGLIEDAKGKLRTLALILSDLARPFAPIQQIETCLQQRYRCKPFYADS